MESQRTSDIHLLHRLNVRYICDLMVEQRKVKYGLTVSSSEKADSQNRYQAFEILITPYPGVEFFRDFRDNHYSARNLVFNWSQNYADAVLKLPATCQQIVPTIQWTEYKTWDLITLTSNYLKMLIKLVEKPNHEGLLIHCISGWDRTPL